MSMRKGAGGAIIAAATTGLMIALSAAPALAATTLTVKVTNGGTYTATATKTVLSDNGVNVTCTSTTKVAASKGTGSVPTGTHTGTSPVKVGTVGTLAFNHCSGPLGPVTTTVLKTPYAIKVDSTTNGTGQTDGIITGVDVKVSMTGCSFVVTGSAPGYYSNGTHTLTMTAKLPIKPLNAAKLTVSGVSGCAGVVNNGDHPKYTSTYTVSRAFKIKST